MTKAKTLPTRDQVNPADCWDLTSLFTTDAAWEKAFKKWTGTISGYEAFRGNLGTSAQTLADCLKFDSTLDRAGEKIGTYANLRTTEDQANSEAQRMIGRFHHAAAQAAEASSWIRPELKLSPPRRWRRF